MNDGALATDAVIKTLAAAKGLGEVRILFVGTAAARKTLSTATRKPRRGWIICTRPSSRLSVVVSSGGISAFTGTIHTRHDGIVHFILGK